MRDERLLIVFSSPVNMLRVNSIIYLVSIISLSSSSTLTRLAEAPAPLIGFWRLLFASLLLLPFLLKKNEKVFSSLKNRGQFLSLVLSSLFFFFHLWTYFLSAQQTSIANCMILFSSNPIFVSIGSSLFLSEAPSKNAKWAYLFAFSGILSLFFDDFKASILDRSGDWWALISAVFFSGYLVSSKFLRRKWSNPLYAFNIYALTSCFFLIAALIFVDRNPIELPTRSWIAISFTVIIPTFLGHFLFSYLMPKMNLSMMSTGKLLEPLLAMFWAHLAFGEKIRPNSLLAFALISIGIYFLLRPNIPSKRKGKY